MGADFVIAVDALGPLLAEKRPKNMLDMTLRWFDIFDWEFSRRKVHTADILLTPETDRTVLDFRKVTPVLDAGYKCAIEKVGEIKEIIEKLSIEN